jgi:hypothetical protein
MQRGESLAEQMGEEQDPDGTYSQIFQNPEGFVIDVSRDDDGQGETLIHMIVYSPCIGNPSDKPAS